MDVDAAWDIVERVLAERVPTVAATLRGPAAPEDVGRLSATVGRELPTSWRVCAVMKRRGRNWTDLGAELDRSRRSAADG